MSRKKSVSPTTLELDVMKVLWDKGESLTINEVSECMNEQGDAISVASVAQVMKKLLEKKIVKVDEHKLVSNVYARTFKVMLKKETYIENEIDRLLEIVSSDSKESTMMIVDLLLKKLGKQQIHLNDAELKKLLDELN